ncbi:MAG: stilbene synthase [Verrucomicrobiota bacterium]
MKLSALASAVPEVVLTQQQCWDRLTHSSALDSLRPASQKLLGQFLLNENGIRQRHLAMHDMHQLAQATPADLNQVFEQEAPALGARALQSALQSGGIDVDTIDALFVCTCTGYLCPGPGSYIAEMCGMRDDVCLFDLVGQGCGAAIPLLHAAAGYLKQHPDHRAACIAVEICSAAFYMDDDPGVLVSLALFGDGAHASIWQGHGAEAGLGTLSGFQSVHLPAARDSLRFINADGFLKNQLHRSVPETVGRAVRKLYQQTHQPRPARIISHGGGRDVLNAVEVATGSGPLGESRAVLRDYGNMSSPSVLFALEQHLQSETPAADLWLVSFGAGFTCHAARFRQAQNAHV